MASAKEEPEQGVVSADQLHLHRLVWDNKWQQLKDKLQQGGHTKIEEEDTRGRTPLMLAVVLGHLECARELLHRGANVNVVNSGGWTVVQEATATGDPEILQLVLERRDRQRFISRVSGIPDLLRKLKSAPDFYVEMKWEFTSWVPFLSRMCPSDTYKVYKQGSNVRIDTTLLGFEETNWVRGNRTYIFQGRDDGADFFEIDHDTRSVYCEQMNLPSVEEMSHAQSDDNISARLVTPLVLTYIDTDKINFERSKAGGLWGWGGSEKMETVSGYECKVFSASNVELCTKTRTEHLTEEDKKRAKSSRNPLQSFLGMAEVEVKQPSAAAADAESEEQFSANNPCHITMEEYFSHADLNGRDIGRPKEMSRRVQKFHAQLWLCEDYPLSLQEQVMPIVDLMAISNAHFQKLKDFITCAFPSGYPVKIEIPLFHVLNARITFCNIFALTTPVEGVSVVNENAAEDADGSKKSICFLDEDVFQIPTSYSRIGGVSTDHARRQYEDDDDRLLQYAIRQSMVSDMDASAAKEEVDIWEALQGQSASDSSCLRTFEDRQLEIQIQRAIELSLASSSGNGGNSSANKPEEVPHRPAVAVDQIDDDDLALALKLSEKEQEESRRRQELEDRQLEMQIQRAIELSLASSEGPSGGGDEEDALPQKADEVEHSDGLVDYDIAQKNKRS